MIVKKIILTLFTVLLVHTTFAQHIQTLHVLVFIATGDNDIGDHLEVTSEKIKDWVAEIETYAPIQNVETSYYEGNDFNLFNLDTAIDELQPNSGDGILFWCVGHGEMDKGNRNTPNVMFLPRGARSKKHRLDNSRNLEDIYNQVSDKCDFVWFIGDACNSPVKNQQPTNMASNSIKTQGLSKGPTDQQLTAYYSRLFSKRKEREFFYFIPRGKEAYTSGDHGALSSYSFMETVKKDIQNNQVTTTAAFKQRVQKEYDHVLDLAAQAVQKAKKGNKKTRVKRIDNPGLGKRLVSFLFEGREVRKLRKRYKQTLDSGNFDELGNLLPKANQNGRESKDYTTFLKLRPTTYFLTMGVFSEYTAQNRQDSTYVAECFCTASKVLEEGLNTDKEYRILRKIDNYNAGSGDPLGITEAGGRLKWLQKKCRNYISYLGKVRDNKEVLRDTLQNKQLRLERNLTSLKQERLEQKRKIDDINARIEGNKEEIGNKKIKWAGEEQEVTYIINKVPTPAERECLENTVKKLINGDTLVNDCEILFAKYITIQRKSNDGLSLDARRKAVSTGYSFGKYCDQNILDATEFSLRPLLRDIANVPESYRNKLEVGLQVIGHADSKPCRGAGCNFKGIETKTYYYKDKNNEKKSISTRAGKNQKINNEQLAFARSLCGQNQANTILSNYSVSKIKYDLVAFVHSTSADSLRGVTVNFELKNRFLHYKENIDKLEATNMELEIELDKARQEMNRLDRSITEAEEGLDKIDEEIRKVEAEIFEIRQDITALEGGKMRENLRKILLARGYTQKEADDKLNNL